MQSSTPEALLSAIAQSGNEVTQGWMRLMGETPSLPPFDVSLQREYLEQQARLWSSIASGKRETLISPQPGDRRFASKEWQDNPYYDYLKQSYLLAARYLEQALQAAPERVRFAARQWLDAMCPANFPATNPVVLREAVESRGESLTRGVANLLTDVQKRRIRQTNESAFEVGRNLAVTPGEVVFENDLIQLIQYKAATAQVAKRPLVMIPPCINKFYILDLQPENSFVAHAVATGNTVFMVSWRNVEAGQGHYGWDDYLELGVFKALRVAAEISKTKEVNALGFCVGGTLLGAALAVLSAKNENLIASATFLAAMLDFSETGQIGLFVDEPSVATREATIGKAGILPGRELAFVFSSLRANDLIWPYVVNNYLLGGEPAAFDLLYWNSDSTNLPGPMYCYYLRNTYLENRLREPRALKNCGVDIDLGAVKLPIFVLATREDHIVPWRSAYRTLHLLGGKEKNFVLGASGHIAGVINPASKKRRSHWVSSGEYPAEPERWLEKANERQGSWWPLWSDWLRKHSGGTRKAPAKAGSANYPPIEPAPGRYVKHRVH